MSAAAFFLGFLNVLLYCAIIVLVAFAIVWILNVVGFPPSAEVMKWGKIVVALLCLIAVVAWLLGMLGAPMTSVPRFFGRW
jgi:NADH:ubiquinone oxidoreductase subunit 6 (subunit J)